jgi:hypothetical protein
MRRSLAILAAIYSAIPAATAYAHHSHPYFYDFCKSVTIEGRIESIQWKQPHSLIVVRLDDGTAYTVEWMGLNNLTTQNIIGPAQAALGYGARITVTGNPIRPASQIREHFPDFTSEVNPKTIDPGSIRRVDNSFTWAPPNGPPDPAKTSRQLNMPACDGK